MKTVRNLIATAALALALALGSMSPAVAEVAAPAACTQSVDQMQDQAKTNEISLEHLNAADVKTITDQMGAPPAAFTDLYLASKGDIGMIMVVKDGCVIGNTQPFPMSLFRQLLGRVPA